MAKGHHIPVFACRLWKLQRNEKTGHSNYRYIQTTLFKMGRFQIIRVYMPLHSFMSAEERMCKIFLKNQAEQYIEEKWYLKNQKVNLSREGSCAESICFQICTFFSVCLVGRSVSELQGIIVPSSLLLILTK